jgi:hypothetical protein
MFLSGCRDALLHELQKIESDPDVSISLNFAFFLKAEPSSAISPIVEEIALGLLQQLAQIPPMPLIKPEVVEALVVC